MHQLPMLLTAPDPGEIKYVYVWGGVVFLAVLVAYFVYSYFKKWMNDTDTASTPGFGLSDLRRLRDEGKMSAEEYSLTREKMVESAKKMTDKMPDVLSRPPAERRQLPVDDIDPSV